jgi:hypothetical protein
MVRLAEHVGRMGEKRDEYRVFVGKREGKRPVGITKRRLQDHVKINLKKKIYIVTC